MEFYKCETCGKEIVILKEGAPETMCCGKPMVKIKPRCLGEKGCEGHTIKMMKKMGRIYLCVGLDSEHPQSDRHYIEWIVVEHENGFTFRKFKVWEDARICLRSCDLCKPINVYVMCNTHGLYKTEMKI
ncbi:MAG: hypothetical protein MJ239_07395 [Bacilli bacterium]|nr:hypothetical protein [Bacilli bacterium]